MLFVVRGTARCQFHRIDRQRNQRNTDYVVRRIVNVWHYVVYTPATLFDFVYLFVCV